VKSEERALFLDRDGVINIDYGHVYRKEEFHFIEGIFDLLRIAIKEGYLIFIITNQAGIGKGLYTLNDFHKLNNWMLSRFLEEKILIKKVYFSPYHPKSIIPEFKIDNHPLRKPNPGMIHLAIDEYNLTLNNSVLIGDKITDLQSGISAGVDTNLLFNPSEILNSNDQKFLQENEEKVFQIACLLDASSFLCS
jgi:D-glycero-D-manno-heptose 1,7-bisphosphate phosphatase